MNLKVLKIPAFFVLHGGTNPPNFHFCALRTFLDLKIHHFVLHESQSYQMSSIYVLRQPHISRIFFCCLEPQYCGCVKMGPFVLLALFPLLRSHFWPIWGQSVVRPLVVLLVFPCFVGISAVYGSRPNSPFVLSDPHDGPCYTPKTLRFKGMISNFDA